MSVFYTVTEIIDFGKTNNYFYCPVKELNLLYDLTMTCMLYRWAEITVGGLKNEAFKQN